LIFAFSIINTVAYSQEIKLNSSDTIPAIKKDTLLNLKANDTLNSKQLDSLALKPKDSIKKPAELLESVIEHRADSLIRQDILNNKITSSLFLNKADKNLRKTLLFLILKVKKLKSGI